MLTPSQFKSNYFSLLEEYQEITGKKPNVNRFDVYHYDTDKYSLTIEHWNNLVKVASIIKSNQQRFVMSEWHTQHECGTAHCIAGWAQSLAQNDTNFDNPFGVIGIAERMLSYHVNPFFYLSDYLMSCPRSVAYEHSGLAEKLVMKWFIDPILEEARRESFELSNELRQFIQKAQKETKLTAV